MRQIKVTILILVIFLVSGCTSNYNVEIYNQEVRVNGMLVESDSTRWNDLVFGIPYYQMINWKTEGDEESPVAEGIYRISSDNQLGIGLRNNYQLLENYENSPGIKSCYQYFSIIEQDDNIVLSTSLENTCFDDYPNLDSITVNLKTNHQVVSSNANIVDGYHYTWNLYKENKDDSAILITLKKDEYIFNYENEFIKKIIYFVVIIGIILGVTSLVYYYFKIRRRNSNKI